MLRLGMSLLRRIPKLLLVLIFTLLVVAVVGFFWWQRQEVQHAPVPTTDQAYPSIINGLTTEFQLQQIVGQPYSEFDQDGWHIETIASAKSPYQPDRFYLKNNVVEMKEQWYEPSVFVYKSSDFIQKYGQPESKMYDQSNPAEVTQVYIYPDKGVAAYIFVDTQLVRRVQFFNPTSLSEYMARWGKNLGPNKPPAFQMEPPTRH